MQNSNNYRIRWEKKCSIVIQKVAKIISMSSSMAQHQWIAAQWCSVWFLSVLKIIRIEISLLMVIIQFRICVSVCHLKMASHFFPISIWVCAVLCAVCARISRKSIPNATHRLTLIIIKVSRSLMRKLIVVMFRHKIIFNSTNESVNWIALVNYVCVFVYFISLLSL